MIDIKKHTKNSEELKRNLKIRGYKNVSDADTAIEAYKKYLSSLSIIESKKATKNKISKEIGITSREKGDTTNLREQISKLNKEIIEETEKMNVQYDKYISYILYFPNILLDDVHEGYSEEDNILIKESLNEKREFDFHPKEHYNIKNIGIDSETAVKLSGSRFTMYVDETAHLERALVNYMLDQHKKSGFKEIIVPTIVKSSVLEGTGHLPKFKDDLYKIENADKWLIPTAEVPLTNIMSNTIIDKSDLPIRFSSSSSSYRSESDSGGKDIKGVIRLHEFRKVEMVSLTTQDQGINELEYLVKQAESILEGLKIPYRRILLCSKEVSTASAITYDLEVWMPGLNTWKEISSISLCTDYQSRNSLIRYKDGEEKKLVYTLNGSGLAVDRCIAAVIENYQKEDGGFEIPQVLLKYYA